MFGNKMLHPSLYLGSLFTLFFRLSPSFSFNSILPPSLFVFPLPAISCFPFYTLPSSLLALQFPFLSSFSSFFSSFPSIPLPFLFLFLLPSCLINEISSQSRRGKQEKKASAAASVKEMSATNTTQEVSQQILRRYTRARKENGQIGVPSFCGNN
uniref:Uncharacterized protein n=1 Tax=Cacopsylla melanoneura TaxID=428564 RepID=A0A8D8W5E4_9HEMI